MAKKNRRAGQVRSYELQKQGKIRRVVFSVGLLALFLLGFGIYRAKGQSDELIASLIHVESGGRDWCVGDTNLEHKAYGPLQVRQPCVDDYNRWHSTSYRAEHCLGNRVLSVNICKSYLEHYATEKRLGRKPTDEDCARIWNGGPSGWKKSSTLGYWFRVRRHLLTG